MARADVLIVGGGIIGAACAYILTKRGLTVTMAEAGPRRGAATRAAGGMLAPLAEAGEGDPLLSLAVRARDYYSELAPALREESGIDIGLETDGILQVAFTDEEVGRAKSAVAWQRQSGFAAHWLSAEELRERAPGINPEVQGAVLTPEDGALAPERLHEALLAAAERRGASILRPDPVEEIRIEADRVQGARLKSGPQSAGAVVVAAGAWSGRIRGLPRPVSVEPMRGQMVALDWPADEPPAVVYGGEGYVLERDGTAIGGSTMEHTGFDAKVTTEGVARILRIVRRLYPALNTAPIRRQWAGLRPMTPDGRPIVGRDPAVQNLWYATGHGRNGILLAALTGEIVARLLADEEVEYDLAPMDPGRFWSA